MQIQGGMFHSPTIELKFCNQDKHPPYIIDLYKNQNLPPKPQMNSEVMFKFKEKNRDKIYEFLKEAMKSKHWEVQTKGQQQIQQRSYGGGIAGIQKKIQATQQYNQQQISSAFADLESLKQKARGMVDIAAQIQNKIKKKEFNAESEEMKEIQQVMFNMGLVTDFSASVSKDLSGKNYHNELSKEIEKFLVNVLDKCGGVLAIVDIYCMYNRARGTDLISPDDLLIACNMLHQRSDKVMIKQYQSGVRVIQSRYFNEDSYYQKLQKIAKEQPGFTADKISNQLNINVVLMKEQLRNAEEKGYLCRDESFEGLRYYDNLFLSLQ